MRLKHLPSCLGLLSLLLLTPAFGNHPDNGYGPNADEHFLGFCDEHALLHELCLDNAGYCIVDHGNYPGNSDHRLVCYMTDSCGEFPNGGSGHWVLTVPFYSGHLGTASLYCHNGYFITGDVTIQCNDTWSTPSEICQPVDCGDPPGVANGNFTARVSGTYLDIADVTCDPGYEVVPGPCSISCLADGTWSNTSASCTILSCGYPGCIPFGDYVPDSDVFFEDTATLTCYTGYEIISGGSPTIECLETGVWSAPTTCVPVSCGTAPSADNGTLTAQGDSTFGDVLLLSCDSGYEVVGEACDAVCQADGNWADTSAHCARKDCGEPPCVTFGSYVPDDGTTLFLDTATATCHPGYESNVSDSVSCQANGTWSPIDESFVCYPVDCGAVPSINNGSFVLEMDSTYMSIATVECDADFAPSGDCSIMCQPDGNWSVSTAECVPESCGNPAAIQGGIGYFDSSCTTVGCVVALECITGYETTGENITCQADLTWSPTTATCTIVTCNIGSVPGIGDGAYTIDGNEYMDHVVYSCNLGYELTDGTDCYIYCTAAGTWTSKSASCTKKDCKSPPCDDHGAFLASGGTDYGDSASLSCYDGYRASSASTSVTCQADGTWSSPTATCVKKNCGSPGSDSNGGWTAPDGSLYMDYAYLWCSSGYEPTGEPCAMYCEDDGSWSSSSAYCTKIDCGNPPCIQNGGYEIDDVSLYQGSASIVCDPGFVKSSTHSVVCQASGAWTSPTVTCDPIDCGMTLNVTNGVYQAQDDGLFMDHAFLYCDSGYEVVGDTCAQVCQTTGLWGPSPTYCQKKDCGNLPCIEGGQYVLNGSSNDTELGDTAQLTCNGVTPSCDETITCRADGTWSGPNAYCYMYAGITPDCGSLPSRTGGQFSMNGDGSIYTTASLTCNIGYEVSGPCTIACLPAIGWEHAGSTCVKIDCGPPPAIQFGTYATPGGTEYYATAKLTCDDYFELYLGATFDIFCQSNGLWFVEASSCIPAAQFCEELVASPLHSLTTEGVYPIKGIDGTSPYYVFCGDPYAGTAESIGPVYTMIARRNDNTNFYRNMVDYQEGFGNVIDGSHVMSLALLSAIKLSYPYEAYIKLEPSGDFVKYTTFSIADNSTDFTMTISGYVSLTGAPGDHMSSLSGSKFSCKDADNDASLDNCAATHTGCWWFVDCIDAYLFGEYDATADFDDAAIQWGSTAVTDVEWYIKKVP